MKVVVAAFKTFLETTFGGQPGVPGPGILGLFISLHQPPSASTLIITTEGISALGQGTDLHYYRCKH